MYTEMGTKLADAVRAAIEDGWPADEVVKFVKQAAEKITAERTTATAASLYGYETRVQDLVHDALGVPKATPKFSETWREAPLYDRQQDLLDEEGLPRG